MEADLKAGTFFLSFEISAVLAVLFRWSHLFNIIAIHYHLAMHTLLPQTLCWFNSFIKPICLRRFIGWNNHDKDGHFHCFPLYKNDTEGWIQMSILWSETMESSAVHLVVCHHVKFEKWLNCMTVRAADGQRTCCNNKINQHFLYNLYPNSVA